MKLQAQQHAGRAAWLARPAREHLNGHHALELKPATLLKLLESLDAMRRLRRLQVFLASCEADARGRLGFADSAYLQAEFIRQAHATAAVSAAEFVQQGLTGPAVGTAMQQARIRAIHALSFPQEES